MYLKHHTLGIVVGGRAESADSRRVNIFTDHFGLISARAQAARGAKSKLRVGVQDFSCGEFSLVHGKSGWKVVSARSEKNLFEIFRSEPEKLKIVLNILNLIKKLVGEEKSHSDLFNIVIKFFKFLEQAKTGEIALAECLTLMRILHILGYMSCDPELAIPILSVEITAEHLSLISPRRAQIIRLINESLKST